MIATPSRSSRGGPWARTAVVALAMLATGTGVTAAGGAQGSHPIADNPHLAAGLAPAPGLSPRRVVQIQLEALRNLGRKHPPQPRERAAQRVAGGVASRCLDDQLFVGGYKLIADGGDFWRLVVLIHVDGELHLVIERFGFRR